jgi:hypothetical protein
VPVSPAEVTGPAEKSGATWSDTDVEPSQRGIEVVRQIGGGGVGSGRQGTHDEQ